MIMCFHYSEAFTAVRLTRWTLWILIAMLLIQGSGAVSLLHKLTHHPGFGADRGGEAAVLLCHDAADPADRSDEHPEPQPGDEEDCSICLGLAGLHLVPAPEPVRVVDIPVVWQRLHIESRVCVIRSALSDAPARAPPVC